tara:strand:+ start:1085 stop:1774 length:690 start_codon:yes stop_codon:yes gene_type:complete
MSKIKTVALIPARAGSKGIKNKNIIKVNNIPLIEYTIKAAEKAKSVDEIFISTNCNRISKLYSNRVNIIKRPEKFSTDSSSSASVVNHFFRYTEDKFKKNLRIIFLQPTSPLRSSKHIDDCLNEMLKNGFRSAVSVTKNNFSPYKSFNLSSKNSLKSLFKETHTNKRRQDLQKTFRSNGAIYIFDKKNFKKNSGFPSNGGFGYIMKEDESIDIDSILDIKKVEELLSKK